MLAVMPRILLGILLVFCFGCDDGDIITVSLDFEDEEVEACGDLVFYKLKNTANKR